MTNEQDIKEFKKHLANLETAYSETLQAFHNVKHYTVRKNLGDAIIALNEAIVGLKEAIVND